ncbi:transcription-repair coupling factor [Desulfolutivibrio sulfodismutans]|nr:transcription-repair coupling factor [Desulfolutivibrio sulfodismutans]
MQYPSEIKDFLNGRGSSLGVYKSGPGTLAFLAADMLASGSSVVVIVPGAPELARLKSLFSLLLSPVDDPLSEAPWQALPTFPPAAPSLSAWAARFAFLNFATATAKPRLCLFTVDNLLPKWPPRQVIEESSIELAVGEDMSRELLLEQAALWGYRRQPMVESPGEVAVRGDVLDIFAPGYALPLRFEFFGDTIEYIRTFDPTTQRSQAELPHMRLLPVAPAVLTDASRAVAGELWESMAVTGELRREAKAALENKLDSGDGTIWPGLFYEKPSSLTDHLPKDAVYMLYDASRMRSRLEEVEFGWKQFLEAETAQRGFGWPGPRLCWPGGMARKMWLAGRQVLFEDLVLGHGKHGPDMPEKGLERFSDLFWKPGEDKRPWSALMSGLRDWAVSKRQVVLSFHGERSRTKFLKMIEHEGISLSTQYHPGSTGLFALVSPLRQGMELTWNRTLILSEDVLRPEGGEESGRASRVRGFKGIASQDEIASGDLVVHRDYGLARFDGLARMTVDSAGGDYLLLHFDGEDRLYVPVDRISLIQKFKGPDGIDPALDRLGGNRWKLGREKAKKAIEKIARDLVEMYAFRKVAKGYAYGPLNELYWEFEAGFGFEETPDQEKAIADVLADMERPEPMDRLVCGDVGFGKTEVALRAAFRAVLDGKQVVMLCPTTVLAEQHFQNFSKRLGDFPVRVGMLSRFVPPKRQKVVTEGVRRGEIDILIGTHRLLSKDVEAPALGLLILDEEQRFGVKHKEKLKALRKNIDVLTLTATPIPRTLQLSLSGIRGLSVIETPPPERKAVETLLVERDSDFLRSVVRRELERQGQVFWVHNRVRGLEETAAFVRRLVPEARVTMAHGQMAEGALEKAMHEFWHGEIDVLVCTAIIESGLDFPRANTLVVDQAQMFGLGQLYQLRGRVGRSSLQAYAYFVVPSLDGIPEVARKRLRIIQDMDFLGAGFQVAMEDLRLRGAGNILGEVQSGQISRIGLDMFLEMLDDEIKRLRGEPQNERTDPELTIAVSARIPEGYVSDPKDRLRLYKALSTAHNESGLAEMAAEMRDRFGALPEEVENFISVLALKQVLARLQVARAEVTASKLSLSWETRPGAVGAVSAENLVAFVNAHGARARLVPPAKLEMRLSEGGLRAGLAEAARELATLCAASPDGK